MQENQEFEQKEQEKTENCENLSNNSEISQENLKTNNEQVAQKNKKQNNFERKLDGYFKYTAMGSSLKKEFFGGFVNFLVIAYVLIVVPSLFSPIGGEQLWRAIFLATILTTFLATICMGFYANLPIVLAPGIGLVSYTVQLVVSGAYSLSQAMALCFLAGVLFLILTITGLRKKLVKAIPDCIKVAIPCGVGLFVLNIGLNSSNSGILDMLNGTAMSYAPIVALVSFFVMAILYIRNVKGSILIGIASGTVLDLIIKLCKKINPFANVSGGNFVPPFKDLIDQTLLNFDFAGLFKGNLASCIVSVLLIVFAITLMDMFDTVGTLYATAGKGNLLDDKGEVVNMDRAMMIDGCSAMFSSLIGIPSATSYVESSAGIASGARTGLSSIFTGLLFLLTMFFSPIVQLIPVYATAPALVLVGILMFDSVLKVNFKDLAFTIPSILTLIIMPLSSNITYGIAVGIISYVVLMLGTKRAKQINVFTYIIALLFVLYFILQYV